MLSFFQKPHTVTALVALLAGLLYAALYLTDDADSAVNTKWGIFAGLGVFILIGMTQFRDGPFTRPHPIVWRGVLSLSIAYEIFLIYLMFQKLDDARQLFKHVNPSLGVPLAEKTYADNCELTKETIWVRTAPSAPFSRCTIVDLC